MIYTSLFEEASHGSDRGRSDFQRRPYAFGLQVTDQSKFSIKITEITNVRKLTILGINLSMTKQLTFKASPSNC